MYHVQQKVVDSFAIGGIPQTRKRVYVVGWKRTCGESDAFEWPSVVPPPLLSDILAENNTKNVPWGVAAGATNLHRTGQRNLRRLLRRCRKKYPEDDPLPACFCLDVDQSASLGRCHAQGEDWHTHQNQGRTGRIEPEHANVNIGDVSSSRVPGGQVCATTIEAQSHPASAPLHDWQCDDSFSAVPHHSQLVDCCEKD